MKGSHLLSPHHPRGAVPLRCLTGQKEHNRTHDAAELPSCHSRSAFWSALGNRGRWATICHLLGNNEGELLASLTAGPRPDGRPSDRVHEIQLPNPHFAEPRALQRLGAPQLLVLTLRSRRAMKVVLIAPPSGGESETGIRL